MDDRCRDLDVLLAAARRDVPDTAAVEEGFEGRLMVHLAGVQPRRAFWEALGEASWRLVPIFASALLLAGVGLALVRSSLPAWPFCCTAQSMALYATYLGN